jgi:hypothetical protein
METIKEGQKWGGWRLDATTMELVLDQEHYRVDLERIDDSAQMLDWIFQLRMKGWSTNEIMGDLLTAFQDIFRPQSTLCGGGASHTIDAKDFLQKKIRGKS